MPAKKSSEVQKITSDEWDGMVDFLQSLTSGHTHDGSGSRSMAAHATSHQPAGSDAMVVDAAAGTGSLRTLGTGGLQATAGNDARLSDARTPTAHATTHQPAGSDAMAVDAAAGTGSLRTLGTGGLQATAGNDARLSDARTPTAHATTHQPAGSDAMAVDAAAGTGSLRTLGTGGLQATAGNDARLSDARTPTAHATTHQPAGSDAMAVDAAAGTGSLRTLGTGALQACAGNDSRLSDSRTPTSHGSSLHTGNVLPAANQNLGAFYMDASQIAAPANPVAGTRRVFVDSVDGKLKVRTSGGSSVSLEEQGGAVSLSTASIAFTDGDTLRRVTVTDAAVTTASKILGTIRRPDSANDSDDVGYIYLANVVKIAAGSFDLLVSCLGWGFDDPTKKPPSETITYVYALG